VRVVEYTTDQNCDPNTIFKLLDIVPGWAERFGKDKNIQDSAKRW
jgi:hypothetical protein